MMDNAIKVMAATGVLIKALGEAYPNGPDETIFDTIGCFISVLAQKTASEEPDVSMDDVTQHILEIVKEYNKLSTMTPANEPV